MTIEDMQVEGEVKPEIVTMDEEGDGEDEEDVSDLQELLRKASALPDGVERVPFLLQLIQNNEKMGPTAFQLKERAVYDLTRAYCASKEHQSIVNFLMGEAGQTYLNSITKAKTAKLVRQILDIVCTASPDAVDMHESIARSILQWTIEQKRSFLRQRVEAKLASILFAQQKYNESLQLCDSLLVELKKLDDKQLLVETHLLESKIHFALRNVPKAKAALTASRTAANAIYVSPLQQADIDSTSGTIHTEEGDYNTAHSYFLEAFEQLDQLNIENQAMKALKYMMLCKILDSLRAALKLSSTGTVGVAPSKQRSDWVNSILTAKQSIKYAGSDIQALIEIARASQNRNLKEFEEVLTKYPIELQQDLLIKHHLHVLKEQLLEANLIRIIEPYSCVEIHFIAQQIDMPITTVEKKLSQMILDGKFSGILDQGSGQLIVYEESQADKAMEKGLQVISNMDNIVTSLFERSKALRTVMM
jgi:26S proteasome regulatory subunit N6